MKKQEQRCRKTALTMAIYRIKQSYSIPKSLLRKDESLPPLTAAFLSPVDPDGFDTESLTMNDGSVTGKGEARPFERFKSRDAPL